MLFNQLLPSWGVTLLLIPLLCHLTHRTACTAARLHRAEASMATLDRWLSVEELQQLQAAQERLRAEAEAERAAAAARVPQGCPPPWLHGLELLALWGLVLGFQLGKQAFDRCSWQFGALYGGQAAATLAASAFFIWQVVREREHGCGCGEHGAVPPPGAPQGGAARLYGPTGGDSSSWEPQRLVSSAGVALAGGTVAGMLGEAARRLLPRCRRFKRMPPFGAGRRASPAPCLWMCRQQPSFLLFCVLLFVFINTVCKGTCDADPLVLARASLQASAAA